MQAPTKGVDDAADIHPHNRNTRGKRRPGGARCSSAGSATATRAAREELVQRYMPLARSLARRYGRSSEPFEDLLQVASLGLLKAIDRYDAERGHPFQSYAVPTILGEMRRYFRDSGWAIHVPRGAQERALKVRDAQERISNETGRAPDRQPARGVPRDRRRGGHRRAAGDPRVRDRLARRSARRRRRGHRPLRRHDRQATTSATSWSSSTRRSARRSRTCPHATGWCCSCASSRTSRRRRSPSVSASPRCRSRACCAARSSSCARLTDAPGQAR